MDLGQGKVTLVSCGKMCFGFLLPLLPCEKLGFGFLSPSLLRWALGFPTPCGKLGLVSCSPLRCGKFGLSFYLTSPPDPVASLALVSSSPLLPAVNWGWIAGAGPNPLNPRS